MNGAMFQLRMNERDPETIDAPSLADVVIVGSMGFLFYDGTLYVRHYARGPNFDDRAAGLARRAALKAEGLCVQNRSHGKATHGELCHRCRLIHRHGLVAVFALEGTGA
jgi:hypothetical protein